MTVDNSTIDARLSLCEQGKDSFTREELLACSRGELFGEGNSQLPAPNMLMMDRIVKINDHGGEHGKGEIPQNSTSHRSLVLRLPLPG